jgi:hypothetical protein
MQQIDKQSVVYKKLLRIRKERAGEMIRERVDPSTSLSMTASMAS